MPTFDIIKQVKPTKTFRVASVIGKFDLQSENIIEQFKGDIDLPKEWQIGLIVGKSGTGKTTIAKQLFENAYITNYEYNAETVLDDMPKECSVEQITSAFNSVGFSSPPSWLKPYSVLSNGQKMRVDLARAILEQQKFFVFDEFTSVVDRNVAQIGSFAMQKAIRKTDKQFIAVTCHFDVQDWLLPDWIFNTDTMTFQSFEGQKKNRPEIKFEIFQTADKSIWKMFAKHHYLSHSHNNAASVFIATVNNEIAGFISILHFPHPKVKNMKKVHRLVILPDYQGAGIGLKLLNEIGKLYKNEKQRYNIMTSAPSLINSLKNSKKWNCVRYGRVSEAKKGVLEGTTSKNRITASFELK
ncbi:ABC_ATPase domain containing protein [uncultured Caudovirales phage]|uniref:ABC_ATPase domain containing protein n=1 Tax=uncultured Caudovirales phage TaxID=2100421 RepID=A0A6J5SWH5_9CAUD|nr:ABC_ATPase domain containing protein [uncultured Caudovirales phage]